jgi:hypothetical protein
MGSNEMFVAAAGLRKSLETFLALVFRLQRVVFKCVLVDPVSVEVFLSRTREGALRTLILGPTRMIGRRTLRNVVLVAMSLLLEFFRTNLAFEVSLVAVLVVLMTRQIVGLFTLEVAFLSVIVDMVTYVVELLEVYKVHVVLQLIRRFARVATSLVRTLIFVDPIVASVLVVLMLYHMTGPFTFVLAFLSVIVDMVTYVVIYMEVYEVHVVLQFPRPSARVATSLILTLMFVDLLLLGR